MQKKEVVLFARIVVMIRERRVAGGRSQTTVL